MKDNSDYYVIADVIVHEMDIYFVEATTQQYKFKFQEYKYGQTEIHVHDIFKGQNEFSGLTLPRKYELLGHLYGMIETLPITVILVGIDKVRLVSEYPQWDIFKAAWTFLTERFDRHIIDNDMRVNKGIIIVDKSSKIPEANITKIVNDLRRFGSYYQPNIDNIVEEPIFIDSKVREAVQIADACAYCTLKHLTRYDKFKKYWEIVHNKTRKGPNGNTLGFGLKVFP
jgi:hypothetical protein